MMKTDQHNELSPWKVRTLDEKGPRLRTRTPKLPFFFAGSHPLDAQRAATLPVLLLVSVAAFVLSMPRAAAQGCAMCYQNAAASGAQGGAALRHGILILLLPALSVFLGIFVFIYRRRHVAR
jgi:hypothetical protein